MLRHRIKLLDPKERTSRRKQTSKNQQWSVKKCFDGGYWSPYKVHSAERESKSKTAVGWKMSERLRWIRVTKEKKIKEHLEGKVEFWNIFGLFCSYFFYEDHQSMFEGYWKTPVGNNLKTGWGKGKEIALSSTRKLGPGQKRRIYFGKKRGPLLPPSKKESS